MEVYKKAYAHLVGEVDDALTLLDTGNLLEFKRIRDILSAALLEAEEMIVSSDELI